MKESVNAGLRVDTARSIFTEMAKHSENLLYVNNSSADLTSHHAEIRDALLASGALPESLADLFSVRRVDGVNPDGSPRWVLDWA